MELQLIYISELYAPEQLLAGQVDYTLKYLKSKHLEVHLILDFLFRDTCYTLVFVHMITNSDWNCHSTHTHLKER